MVEEDNSPIRSGILCLLVALFGVSHAADAAEALDIVSLVRSASPAVVTIESQDERRFRIGIGSGFLISPDGILVTNHHVIRNAHYLVAHFEEGTAYSVAKAIGFNCDSDLAVLKLNSEGTRLPFLRLGHTENIESGERVIAIGSPIGLPATVSEGIISGTRREATTQVRFLQTTAAISAGSSGGPLIREGPEVVGVTTFGALGAQNLNFAVPSEYVIAILRNPNPTGLRTAGAACEDSPFTKQLERQETSQRASDVIGTQLKTISALIEVACERIAKNYEHYRNCATQEVVKVRGLMTYLEKKTKTRSDMAALLIECDNSWSRHGGLWNFSYFNNCIRSEVSQYRLRGYRVR